MKFSTRTFLTALLVFGWIASLQADAESETEPASDQPDFLQKAIAAFPIQSSYSDEEKTAYYLRTASFMGRIKTPAGFRQVFRFTFIRSSSYEKGRFTPPPRGHTFAAVFDDSLQSVWYREGDDLRIDGLKLIADGGWTEDLSKLVLEKLSKLRRLR